MTEFHDALSRFDELLERKAREAEFQKLFAACPYILSRSLPLRLEPSDIRPLGRPGRSEPDFLAYPSEMGVPGQYGVIELKRPGTQLLVERRKGILQLSSDASTAVAQGEAYRENSLVPGDQMLVLGNQAQIFVIAGLSAELAEKLGTEIFRSRVQGELPGGCQLIPYDVLRDSFSRGIPPQVMVLVPWIGRTEFRELISLAEAEAFWWPRFTLGEESVEFWREIEDRAAAYVSTGDQLISRDYFEIAEGSFRTGELLADGPYSRYFADQVLRMLKQLESAAMERGIATSLTQFIGAADMMLREDPPLPDGVARNLRSLVEEKRGSDRDGLVLASFVDAAALEDLGILRPAVNPHDGRPIFFHGNEFHALHPMARFLPDAKRQFERPFS